MILAVLAAIYEITPIVGGSMEPFGNARPDGDEKVHWLRRYVLQHLKPDHLRPAETNIAACISVAALRDILGSCSRAVSANVNNLANYDAVLDQGAWWDFIV
jgi:hypothetical protein